MNKSIQRSMQVYVHNVCATDNTLELPLIYSLWLRCFTCSNKRLINFVDSRIQNKMLRIHFLRRCCCTYLMYFSLSAFHFAFELTVKHNSCYHYNRIQPNHHVLIAVNWRQMTFTERSGEWEKTTNLFVFLLLLPKVVFILTNIKFCCVHIKLVSVQFQNCWHNSLVYDSNIR